jgi:hypothetical protein
LRLAIKRKCGFDSSGPYILYRHINEEIEQKTWDCWLNSVRKKDLTLWASIEIIFYITMIYGLENKII